MGNKSFLEYTRGVNSACYIVLVTSTEILLLAVHLFLSFIENLYFCWLSYFDSNQKFYRVTVIAMHASVKLKLSYAIATYMM